MIKGQDSSSPGRPDAPGNGRAPGSKRAASEARLLKAAEEVFAQTGFAGARTAQIAQRAGLPKANLHYYFRTKEAIYQRVLENVLEVWLGMGELDPARRRSHGSAHAATSPPRWNIPAAAPSPRRCSPTRSCTARPSSRATCAATCANGSTRKPRSSKAGPPPAKWPPSTAGHLLFLIWAMTQTYADFDVQVAAVLGRDRLAPRDYQEATALITRLLLAGCGLRRE